MAVRRRKTQLISNILTSVQGCLPFRGREIFPVSSTGTFSIQEWFPIGWTHLQKRRCWFEAGQLSPKTRGERFLFAKSLPSRNRFCPIDPVASTPLGNIPCSTAAERAAPFCILKPLGKASLLMRQRETEVSQESKWLASAFLCSQPW